MARRLAVIKNFNIGVGDRGRPAIWFTTKIDEHQAALQVIEGAEAIYDFINDFGRTNIMSVEGTTCWVEVSPSLVQFKELAKL